MWIRGCWGWHDRGSYVPQPAV
ncbi:hypothetical protein E4T89_10670 [Jeotgalicoccus nanhaiensis]|uniref:YXWGXW repeat-containing protein n=1 Tax=Jeotgalicoccus nanhaiensis TaxID=568603 RepID=A0ABR9Y0Y7_9STAP|nr:YXWGXW repeat-containing protein [Jeotgalicoccus nanhaiensis]TFU60915.1 hypothetical protein E4T89_10670 [Jeotgalicoccus nanhaiensis]